MSAQVDNMIIYAAISIIILLVSIKFVYGYCVKQEKTALKKRRVVQFKPKIEGNKFVSNRRGQEISQHIENTVKQYLSTNTSNLNINVSLIDNVNKDFAFFIRNVLTKQECQELIAASEATGFEQRKYSGKGDDSSSCCFQSNKLANDIIFNRIKQFLPKKSYFDADCMYLSLSLYK